MEDKSFSGTGLVTWWEAGHLNHQNFDDSDKFRNFIKDLQTRMPKAHIAWYIINWDEKTIQAARGIADA